MHFPFENPYKVQYDIMNAVVDCVQNGVNGLIESPTGTGKTLSILCSAIATLRHMRIQYQEKLKQADSNIDDEKDPDIPSRIIYCTRTHSQINQIFDELKARLPYQLRISPFASRKHSCIYENLPEQFPSGNALNLSCKLLRKLNTIQQKMNKEASLTLIKRQPDIEDTVSIIKTGCPYYYGYSFDKKEGSRGTKPDKSINFVASKLTWETPLSVPDYTKLGQINSTCPYYLMRSRIAHCDLAIIPYNYLIDKNLRDQVELDLKNSVIVFDEGHNIETYCEELFTFELSVNDLFQIYQALNQIWLQLQTEEQMLSEYQRYQVKGQRVDTKALCIFVLKIIDVLDSYNLTRDENKVFMHNMPTNMNVYRLPELFAFFAMVFGKLKDEKDMMLERMRNKRININDGNLCKLNDTNGVLDQGGELSFGEKLDMFVTILERCILESGGQHAAGKQMNKLYDALLKVKIAYEHFQEQKGNDSNKQKYYDFYVCICDEQIGPNSRRKLSLWCFNPSFAFKSLLEEKPRCVIFTSGTLAPLNTYASELGTIFPVKLENEHVIDKDRVLVGVVTSDLENRKLSFTFDKREDTDFFVSFAKSLQRIFQAVPKGGILVFVPSYTVLKKLHKAWRTNKVYKTLFSSHEIFIEPQDQEKNRQLLEDYRAVIKNGGRAAFIAVCRGKVSEGIDFVDEDARCVVMAGVPYPQIYDPKVVTKKDYLDRKQEAGKSQINGNAWYKLQACRAVNQAIGRVIRHINDYGVIILMDDRYKTHNIDISKWLYTRKKVYHYFPELETDLKNFFIKNSGGSAEEQPTFQKPSTKLKQSRLQGFLTKSSVKPQINIKYDFDIPETPATIEGLPQGFSMADLKGQFTDVESSSSMSLGFMKSNELTGQKRSWQKSRKPIGNIMDDRDEGQPFCESLDFKSEERFSNDNIQTSSNSGRGGYKRKQYGKR